MMPKDKINEILKMDPESQRGLLLMELYLHIIAVENLLIKTGLMTEKDIHVEMESVRENVLAYVKENPDLLNAEPKPIPDRSKN